MPSQRLLDADADRDALLRVARAGAEQFLRGALDESLPLPSVPGTFGGCFVTLWAASELRGCRGTIGETTDLTAAVAQAAAMAVTDPRFENNAVAAEELVTLDIEVSVLSAAGRTEDPAKLVAGVHGVLVRRGRPSGCFLPRVATEYGWDAEQFLSSCCRLKAGLEPDAWRRPDTEVLLFTADAFRESEMTGLP